MSTRMSLLNAFLAWAVFLFFGSGSAQFLSSPPEPPAPASAQLLETPATIVLDAAAILQSAYRTYDSADWLAVDVRQRRLRGDRWESAGSLQIGPNGCCRSDMTTHVGAARRVLVVSDGRIVAKIVTLENDEPKVEGSALSQVDGERKATLAQLGCAGPAAILQQAIARGTDWAAQPAGFGDRPAIVLTGQLIPLSDDPAAPKFLRLYFDAERLHLARAEWSSDRPERGGIIMFDAEFTNSRINQPLSQSDCEKVFSYHPAAK